MPRASRPRSACVRARAPTSPAAASAGRSAAWLDARQLCVAAPAWEPAATDAACRPPTDRLLILAHPRHRLCSFVGPPAGAACESVARGSVGVLHLGAAHGVRVQFAPQTGQPHARCVAQVRCSSILGLGFITGFGDFLNRSENLHSPSSQMLTDASSFMILDLIYGS